MLIFNKVNRDSISIDDLPHDQENEIIDIMGESLNQKKSSSQSIDHLYHDLSKNTTFECYV
jgi:hypothetical protein